MPLGRRISHIQVIATVLGQLAFDPRPHRGLDGQLSTIAGPRSFEHLYAERLRIKDDVFSRSLFFQLPKHVLHQKLDSDLCSFSLLLDCFFKLWGEVGSRWRQDGPKWRQDDIKMAPRWSKMEPRWLKIGPRWGKMVP